jgi:hypothetical protein
MLTATPAATSAKQTARPAPRLRPAPSGGGSCRLLPLLLLLPLLPLLLPLLLLPLLPALPPLLLPRQAPPLFAGAFDGRLSSLPFRPTPALAPPGGRPPARARAPPRRDGRAGIPAADACQL